MTLSQTGCRYSIKPEPTSHLYGLNTSPGRRGEPHGVCTQAWLPSAASRRRPQARGAWAPTSPPGLRPPLPALDCPALSWGRAHSQSALDGAVGSVSCSLAPSLLVRPKVSSGPGSLQGVEPTRELPPINTSLLFQLRFPLFQPSSLSDKEA